MAETDDLQKLKNDYPDFFRKLPQELADFIFSEEVSSRASSICLENKVTDGEKISEIAYRIALVMLGRLPKENLIIALQGGVGLSEETAKKISIEANRLIFLKMPQTKNQPTRLPEITQKPSGPDTYRESVE